MTVDRPLIECAELANVAGVGLGREYFSHRWNVGSSGGVRLFSLILEELNEELIMTHLLAFGSERRLSRVATMPF